MNKETRDGFAALSFMGMLLIFSLGSVAFNMIISLLLFFVVYASVFESFGYGDEIVMIGGLISTGLASLFCFVLHKATRFIILQWMKAWIWAHPNSDFRDMMEEHYFDLVKGKSND
jgi:hypothetical protein